MHIEINKISQNRLEYFKILRILKHFRLSLSLSLSLYLSIYLSLSLSLSIYIYMLIYVFVKIELETAQFYINGTG